MPPSKIPEIEERYGEPIRDILQRMYIDNRMSATDISKEFGTSQHFVLDGLKNYRIQIRDASESKRGRKFSEKTRKKMSESRKGKTHSPEHRIKLAKKNRARSKIPEVESKYKQCLKPILRRKYVHEKKTISEITEEILRETEINISYRVICRCLKNYGIQTRDSSETLKGRKLSEEHKRKISEAIRGENNPRYGKRNSEEHKKKWIQANQQSPNNLEGLLISKLQELGLFAEDSKEAQHGQVYYPGHNGNTWYKKLSDGKFKLPDFKVKGQNKVVEIYGNYWHSEEFVKKNNGPDYAHDSQRMVEEFSKVGIDAKVYWESEVLENPDRIVAEIVRWINNFKEVAC